MKRAVLLCPGQGAQRVGMGRDLAKRFASAKFLFQAVDDALGFRLSSLMWDGPEADLTLTHNAQPAILTHTLAVFSVIAEAIAPVAAAGHSLGEYSAYAAAGSLTPVDAASLVRRRGELMRAAGRERPGSMAAVLGLETGRVEAACAAASSADQVVVAANINTRDQTVVSGDPRAVEAAGKRCQEAGARRVLPLKVSGAFHSPLMQPAQDGLLSALASVEFRDPEFPVIANATAEPVGEADVARQRLGEQLTAPVRWVASMERAAELAGATPVIYLEIGPGNVLSGLLKRIVPGASTIALGTADDVDGFLRQAA